MLKLQSNPSTLAIAAAITVVIVTTAAWLSPRKTTQPALSTMAVSAAHAQGETSTPAQRWAASATGRVEPVSGRIRLLPEAHGRIEEVLVKTNDKVKTGDILAILDTGDIPDKLTAARAQVDVSKRDRKDRRVTGIAKDRQKAQDAVAKARRDLFDARRALDTATIVFHKDGGSAYSVTTARETVDRALTDLETTRETLADLNTQPKMPALTRVESALALARSNLAISELAFERTRVRAPFNGTVLNVFANTGDMASPTSRQPLLTFGDVSKLRVRAEVEERDIANVRVGQKVVLRTDAFPDQEFLGTVTEIASALGAPRIATRGPRRPNDVDVLEVVAEIDGTPPLLTGMRVDVFFKPLEGDALN